MKAKTQQLSIRERYNLFKDLMSSLEQSTKVEGRFRYKEGLSDEYFANKYGISKQAIAYHRVREIGKLEDNYVNPRDLESKIALLEQRLATIEYHLRNEMVETMASTGMGNGITSIPINTGNRPTLR